MVTVRYLALAVSVWMVLGVVGPVSAQDSMGAHLSGVQEVPPVFSAAHGFALLHVDYELQTISYSVVYFDLGSSATQAHIHFGTPGVNGAIVAFLCTNLPNKPTGLQVQACPNAPGFNTISGTLTAADLLGVPAQGVGGNNFDVLAEIVSDGAGYVNVHSEIFPGGEIRGPLGR